MIRALITTVIFCAAAGAQNPQAAAFPARVATDSDLLVSANNAHTTLTVAINSVTTSVTFAAAAFPVPASVTIDTEILLCSSHSGNTYTCARGQQGTTASTHAALAPARNYLTSAQVNQASAEIQGIEKSLGRLLENVEGLSVKRYGAVGDGTTIDGPAIAAAFAALAAKGGGRIYFPPGTYVTNSPLVIPNKTQIYGAGRGDPGGVNSTIQAGPAFPGGALITMGDVNPSFGIRADNMTIDCHDAARATIGISNRFGEEQSGGSGLLILNCSDTGIETLNAGNGTGAENAGPFSGFEVLPGSSGVTTTTCVRAIYSDAFGNFHGFENFTCNGQGYSSYPATAVLVEGQAALRNFHVERWSTAVQIGDATHPAQGVIVDNAYLGGPQVTTGIKIYNNVSSQSIALRNIICNSCTTTIDDALTGFSTNTFSVGSYTLGDGAGSAKTRLHSIANGINNMEGPLLMHNGALLFPDSNAISSCGTGIVCAGGGSLGDYSGTFKAAAFEVSSTPQTINGSSGSVLCSTGLKGSQKLSTCYLNGYAQTGTAQQFTFPAAYSGRPTMTIGGGSCGIYNPTVTATAISFPANAGMTSETCMITVSGQ